MESSKSKPTAPLKSTKEQLMSCMGTVDMEKIQNSVSVKFRTRYPKGLISLFCEGMEELDNIRFEKQNQHWSVNTFGKEEPANLSEVLDYKFSCTLFTCKVALQKFLNKDKGEDELTAAVTDLIAQVLTFGMIEAVEATICSGEDKYVNILREYIQERTRSIPQTQVLQRCKDENRLHIYPVREIYKSITYPGQQEPIHREFIRAIMTSLQAGAYEHEEWIEHMLEAMRSIKHGPQSLQQEVQQEIDHIQARTRSAQSDQKSDEDKRQHGTDHIQERMRSTEPDDPQSERVYENHQETEHIHVRMRSTQSDDLQSSEHEYQQGIKHILARMRSTQTDDTPQSHEDLQTIEYIVSRKKSNQPHNPQSHQHQDLQTIENIVSRKKSNQPQNPQSSQYEDLQTVGNIVSRKKSNQPQKPQSRQPEDLQTIENIVSRKKSNQPHYNPQSHPYEDLQTIENIVSRRMSNQSHYDPQSRQYEDQQHLVFRKLHVNMNFIKELNISKQE